MTRRIRPVALALLAALALPACGGDGSPSASPAPSTESSAPASTSPLSPAASPTSSWPAGCPSPAAPQPGWTLITATVSGGKVTPPRKTYDVTLRSIVRLLVTADVEDEVHLHTYDRRAKTTPGCPVAIDFEAGIGATVEVELEEAGLHLFEVRAR